MVNITPLEAWIKKKACIDENLTGELLIEALKDYQLRSVNEIIDYARGNTNFYRRHLASIPNAPLSSLSDLARIPFTFPADIRRNPFDFLAVRQDDIARIVTLRTSGSTGEAKRLFFTEGDLELTMDFFHHGMSTLVRPGQRVAILLPGERPDSVGDLLARALQRMNVHSLRYGPVTDPIHAAQAISSFGAHCLVGIPTQVLSVARSQSGPSMGKDRIESVLLTTDYVPVAIAETLKDVWGCRVFNHYGMTEMGLGGGVECEALDGYHLREGDMYFELVDHETGNPCPDGMIGEVVFTTLTRRGMPLIRYRTGDIARFIRQPCPCGSILTRMGSVKGRWNGAVSLGHDSTLTLSEMDEVLFRFRGILDYRASISKGEDGRFRLVIDIHGLEGGTPTAQEVLKALNDVEAIGKGIASGNLEVPTVNFSIEGRWITSGMSKRQIIVMSDTLK